MVDEMDVRRAARDRAETILERLLEPTSGGADRRDDVLLLEQLAWMAMERIDELSSKAWLEHTAKDVRNATMSLAAISLGMLSDVAGELAAKASDLAPD